MPGFNWDDHPLETKQAFNWNDHPIDTDAALTSDDPQAAVAGRGWGKILDGGEQTGQQFEDPRRQEIGLQQPAIDPIDMVGGAVAGRIGSTLGRDAASILGNEVGAVGRGVKKAVKPKGLPMDEASRLARAKEMGFDTGKTYYHGTSADIDAFKLNKSKSGNIYGKGVYSSTLPEEAADYTQVWDDALNEYAPASGGNVIPIHLRANNTLDLQDVPLKVKKDLAKLVAEKRGVTVKSLGPNYIDGAGADGILAAAQTHGATPEEITEIFKSHGYDSVKRKSIINVFEPNQIRSKFAEFDPKKKDSGNISAGIAGVGLGPVGLSILKRNQERELEE